jgi:hypothetical protein
MLTLRILALALFVAGAAHAQNLPIANAGPDQTIDCALPTGQNVTLDASGSSDGDGDTGSQPLTYSWKDTDGDVELSTEAMPTLSFEPGTHVLSLTVNDGTDGDSEATDDGSESDSLVTLVVNADTNAPELVMDDLSDVLFPPNHKTHPYAIADMVESVTDDCSELTIEDVVFSDGSSDEDDNGKGDGNTKHDVVFSDDCSEAHVRAERAGPGDGRVYTLNLHVDDEAGNRASDNYQIAVPHDRGRGHEAVDSGTSAEYFSACHDAVAPAACPPGPSECAAAGAGSLSFKTKQSSLRLRVSDFGAAALTDEAPLVCLYEVAGEAAPAGGAASFSKVKIKATSARASAKGAGVMLPELPVEGALRAELHTGETCVAVDFEEAKQKAGKYRARIK